MCSLGHSDRALHERTQFLEAKEGAPFLNPTFQQPTHSQYTGMCGIRRKSGPQTPSWHGKTRGSCQSMPDHIRFLGLSFPHRTQSSVVECYLKTTRYTGSGLHRSKAEKVGGKCCWRGVLENMLHVGCGPGRYKYLGELSNGL